VLLCHIPAAIGSCDYKVLDLRGAKGVIFAERDFWLLGGREDRVHRRGERPFELLRMLGVLTVFQKVENRARG